MSSKKYVSFQDEHTNVGDNNDIDSFENHLNNNVINDAQITDIESRISSPEARNSPMNEQVIGSFAAATQTTPSSPNSGSNSSGSNESSNNSNSIFSLTRKKKQKPMPKIQSSGVVNYGGIGIGQNSDSESESVASTISNNSNAGYALPFQMQSGFPNPALTEVDDDELSQRTPIPKAPPNPAINAILPSDFLRNRTNSDANMSDISEDDSVVKRQKREEENVGRLVHAAKQQQSFAQAWFSAGQAQNALPPIPPKKKLPSNAPPGLKTTIIDASDKKSSGPIDLDSGEAWDQDQKKETSSAESDDIENHSKLNLEIGSFNWGTTHSAPTKKRANKKMIQFGVPEDEDLTTYYIENKCLDRIVCTIGDTKCTFLALIVVIGFVLLLSGGGISAGIFFSQQGKLAPSAEPSSAPTLSQRPTLSLIPSMAPTALPTMTPSSPPTSRPSSVPSADPTSKPSETPTEQPTSRPSATPTYMPSSSPSDSPTQQPSSQPSLSSQPSSAPSDQPSTCFSSVRYDSKGQDLRLELENPFPDRFGHSVSLSQDGNIVATSVLLYPENRGSVRVYERQSQGNVWQLKGDIIEHEEGFGSSLELSDDGLTLVIGKSALEDQDVIRVYRYNPELNRWIQLGTNIIENASILAGFTVSISGDGTVIAVGDHGHDFFTGRVRVYEFDGTDWAIRGQPIDGSAFDVEFGHSVSLSQNGNILACGAPREGLFSFAGAVRIFKWNKGTTQWEPLGSDIESTDFLEARFGFSVSLSDSESNPRVAIGAPFAFTDFKLNSGSVTVWEFDGFFWNQVGSEIVGIPAPEQKFGLAVSIAGDGTHVAVGNPVGNPITTDGEVKVYFYNGNLWDETIPLSGDAFESGFGHSIDLSKDGTTLAVGASSRFRQGYTQVFESEDDCES